MKLAHYFEVNHFVLDVWLKTQRVPLRVHLSVARFMLSRGSGGHISGVCSLEHVRCVLLRGFGFGWCCLICEFAFQGRTGALWFS